MYFMAETAMRHMMCCKEIYDEIHRLTVSYENEEIRITMTFGLEEYDKNDGMEMAIRRADEKLYQEKRPDAIRSFIEAGGVSEKICILCRKYYGIFGKIRYNMLYCEKAYMITREELTKNNGRK